MKFVEAVSSVLGFRTIPTTILAVLAYVAVFTSIFLTDELPRVPKNQKGVDLQQAYTDLHHIAARPHPYNSHANDDVREYILSRMEDVASRYPHVHIDDDMTSNGSWANALYGVYFEGTNVLLKIDGTDNEYREKGGALFSAHYDSVSTAPGATDDGMGVVTLMQLVEYFAKNRPKRTVVFNLNNGEEDWLNGAHAFLQHPWSKIADTFLNLEGASSGGRPIVFRATSTAPLLSFLPKHVPHPHANVLSADGFARGFIRSGTDYTVYTARGIEGLDLAFYKGRSKYHTKYDSVPYTEGQERSLWSMLEASRGSGSALANDDSTHARGKASAPVYFDLFAAALVVFPLSTLFTIDIVSLVIGPIVLLLLVAIDHIARRERPQHQNGAVHRTGGDILRDAWEWFKDFRWIRGFWMWAKFWVAVIITIGLQVLLVFGFVKLNPFIVYSSPYLALLSSFTLAFITLNLILRLPILAPHGLVLPEQQKQTVLIQTYILTWFLLLLSTFATGKAQIGGLYFITVWNVLVFIACVIGCIEDLAKAHGTRAQQVADGDQYRVPGALEDDDEDGRGSTERTPLIRGRARGRSRSPVATKEEGGAIGWWIVQFLLVIPPPLILVGHITNLLLDAMAQTLADGSSAVSVYAVIALFAFLLALPLAPLSFKIHMGLIYLLSVVFIAQTAYLWLAFPFSISNPLKVFFQQKVTLGQLSTESSSSTKVVTALTGTLYYLKHMIIPKLPSSYGKDIQCYPEPSKQGLFTCEWDSSSMIPSPGGQGWGNISESTLHTLNGQEPEWIRALVDKTGSTSARIALEGRNTRSCRLYFDNQHVYRYNVSGTGGQMQEGFEVQHDGIENLRLWSRTWDRQFVVDVEWKDRESLEGRVACEWVEYESASVDHGIVEDATAGLQSESAKAKIPALEEVLTFIPEWAVVSKNADGLVEVTSPFVL